jgi:hypothetical protein
VAGKSIAAAAEIVWNPACTVSEMREILSEHLREFCALLSSQSALLVKRKVRISAFTSVSRGCYIPSHPPIVS